MSINPLEAYAPFLKKILGQSILVIVLCGGLVFLNKLNQENKAANEKTNQQLIDYLSNDQKEMVKMQEKMLNAHEKQNEQLQKLNKNMETLIYETKRSRP